MFIRPHSSLKNHTRFQTKIGKVYPHFQTKRAQKPYPLGRHIPQWLIWRSNPPPPSTGFQGAVFTHVRHVLTRVVALSLLWCINNMAALTSCENDLYLLILWSKSNHITFKWNVFGTLRAEVNFWGVNKLTNRLTSQANDFANTSSYVLAAFCYRTTCFSIFYIMEFWNFAKFRVDSTIIITIHSPDRSQRAFAT